MKQYNQKLTIEDGAKFWQGWIPRKFFEVPYARLFSPFLLSMMLDEELFYRDVKVLILMTIEMDKENKVSTSQAELSKQLGIGRTSVTRAIKKLIEKDFIRITGNVGKQNVYTVSPYIAYKGYGKHYSQACREWDYQEQFLSPDKAS